MRKGRDGALALGLLLLVAIAFGRAVTFGFTGYDDPLYVSSNPHVLRGLTPEGVRYAFTTFDTGNWHPLTWLSLMLDASIGGARPATYHATSVLLHAASTLTLFFFLRRATGRAERAAFVAALFAVHPLHVESVAWIAERKDVLSGLLFFLALLAYVRYVERATAPRYAGVVALFALGLLAKPMLVTLPLVLLLLDLWPLSRPLRPRLLLEKLPLLALSAASSAVTVLAQQSRGAVAPLEQISLPLRLMNAGVSAVVYLLQALWPRGLAVLYPFPGGGVAAGKVALAVLVLAGLTALAVAARRSRPSLLTGWLWYLAMLLPVIGIVQVGIQARADRYTYLPLVGIFLAAVWAAADLPARLRAAAGTLVLLSLLSACFVQVGHWHDRLTLFRHLTHVVPEFAPGHLTVGAELLARGDAPGARASFERALRLAPGSPDPHADLALWHLGHGSLDDALRHAQEAVRLGPQFFEPHLVLGKVLARLSRHAEAADSFGRALALEPGLSEARAGRADALLLAGRGGEAIEALRVLVAERPRDPRLRNDLGVALLREGRFAEAAEELERSLRLAPGEAPALANLGSALLSLGRVDEAEARLREALRADPDNATAHFAWGMLLSRKGDQVGALREFERVVRLQPDDARARRNLEILREAVEAPW